MCVSVTGQGQLADMPTRGLDDSWTGHLTDWSTRVLDKLLTGQLADATGDFACLVFVLLAASARPRVVQSTTCPVRELTSPRDVQSASWQSASWHICELSSYLCVYVGSAPSKTGGQAAVVWQRQT